MSTWAHRAIQCPCGHSFTAQVADGLHVTRLPEVRQRILDRTFHRARCPRCGVLRTIEKKLLYTDFHRHHWIGVCPPSWTAMWSALEDTLAAEFDRVICRAAPPAVQALGPRFAVRLVFGYDQLAEKLYLFDAGLDDRAVELVKLRILKRHPDEVRPGMQMLLLPPAPGASRLEFEIFRRGEEGHARVGCDRALYEHVLATRETYRADPALAALEARPFVNLDRFFYPPVETPEQVAAGALWSEELARRAPPIAPPPGSPGAILMAPALPLLPRLPDDDPAPAGPPSGATP